MADAKTTQLSIVLRTVDRATAGIKAVSARLDAITKPTRDFKKALSDLKEKSGFDDIASGFKGVGSAIGDLLGKVALIGGAVGLAVAGLFKLVGEFDDLGDKAERFGVSVDFLAQMRFAAEKAGAPVEALDSGLQALSVNLGQLRAGTGRMKAFLDKVNPAFERQLKGAKTNAEAFDLLATGMAKIKDPAKAAALAAKTIGDPALAPLLMKGGKGVAELRAQFLKLAGSQEGAAAAAGETDNAMHDFHASVQGVKAALVEGLSPALTEIVKQLTDWFAGHREDVKEWAVSIGKKLPAAFNTLVDGIKSAVSFLTPFFNSATKIKIAIAALVAIMVGPLLSAIVTLGIAIATNPIGLIATAIAALAIAWVLVITHWDEVKAYFTKWWDWLGKKLGPLRDILAVAYAPFIYIPAKIIQYWGPISSFFTSIWDAVTGAFSAAWNFIKGIVDKVMGAVDKISGAVDTVKAKIGLGPKLFPGLAKKAGEIAGVSTQAQAAVAGGAASNDGRIIVDFKNAPTGTRANVDPQSAANIDLSMGHQMMFAP